MWLQPDKCYLFEVQTIYQNNVSNLKYWTRKLLVQFVAESVRAICLPIWPNSAWMGLMRRDGRLLITPDDSLQVWWHHHHWCGKHKLMIFVQCSHGHEPFTKVLLRTRRKIIIGKASVFIGKTSITMEMESVIPAMKRHFIIKGEEKWLSIGMLSSGCQSIASHPGQIGQHKRQKQAWSHPRWTPFRKKKDPQCNEFVETSFFLKIPRCWNKLTNVVTAIKFSLFCFVKTCSPSSILIRPLVDLNNLTLMKILTLLLLGRLVTFCWR